MNISTAKIEIIAPQEKSERLMEELQNIGVMEVTCTSHEETKVEKTDEWEEKKARMQFAYSFLTRYSPKSGFAKNLISSFIPQPYAFYYNEIQEIADSPEIDAVIRECINLEEKLNALIGESTKLKEDARVLQKVINLPITKENKKSLQNFSVFVGSAKKGKRENLISDLRNEVFSFFYGENEEVFALVYPKEKEDFFREKIQEYEAKEEDVFWEDIPEREIEKIQERIEEKEEEIKKQEAVAESLASHLPKIAALVDFYAWESEKFQKLNKAEKTEKFFRVTGWVGENDIERLQEAIKKSTDTFLLQKITPEKEENPPVLLRNSGIMRSFGVVSGVYGAPKSNEPDPAPFLAPFFALAFGVALSDIGYGLMLIGFSLLMKKLYKGVDAFFNLFIIGGVFTLFAGLIMGTFFGTDLNANFRIFDPSTNPMEVLILVSVFGALQIFCGLLIGAVWDIKQGDKKAALGEKGGFMAFLLGIAAFLISGMQVFLFAALGSLVLLNIIFSKAEKPLLRFSSGAGALYNVIGYFSDVLSYSRLLALGLATGIIAMVVNVVAEIAMEMIPVAGLGFVFAGMVLVVGHTFNLLISTLGSFIHSARLQFVEFFSKFMEGGGRTIKPFSKQGRFVEIIH